MSYIDKIDSFFHRNNELLTRCIIGFGFILVAVYFPGSLIIESHNKDKEKQALISQISEMQNRIGFYELEYNQQQKIMGDVDCLAKNIYYEAGGEPIEGKIAVAQVTMNRVHSGNYARTVCGVVKQKVRGICQFSWVCNPKLAINTASTAWRDSRKIAENILISKKKYGIINSSVMNYHASYANPSWAETKTFVKQIGQHLFYKT